MKLYCTVDASRLCGWLALILNEKQPLEKTDKKEPGSRDRVTGVDDLASIRLESPDVLLVTMMILINITLHFDLTFLACDMTLSLIL